MKEASPAKFYFAKYFFLAFGLLQWLCGLLLFLQSDAAQSKQAAFGLFVVGLLFLGMYNVVASRLKRVAVTKSRVTIFVNNHEEHYEWPEVKWIKIVPYLNLYKLKLRGRKERIYFLPGHSLEPMYGLFHYQPSSEGAIRKKLK